MEILDIVILSLIIIIVAAGIDFVRPIPRCSGSCQQGRKTCDCGETNEKS